MESMESLESRALRQFDKLVQDGSIIFKDVPAITVPAQPFNVRKRDEVKIHGSRVASSEAL